MSGSLTGVHALKISSSKLKFFLLLNVSLPTVNDYHVQCTRSDCLINHFNGLLEDVWIRFSSCKHKAP